MFARVKDDVVALRRYFLLLTEGLANVLFPATIGAAIVAPEFVELVLTDRWREAVIPLQVLSFYTGFHMLATLLAPILHARGEVRFAARNGIYTLFILPPAFFIFGKTWGTAGIAFVWLTAYPMILVPMYRKVFASIEVTPRMYFKAVWPAVSSTLVMAACVLGVRFSIPASVSLGWRFTGEVLAGAVAYGAMAWFVHRDRILAMKSFLSSARR
jgi:O-antigen/teichoic acid export membrane protein